MKLLIVEDDCNSLILLERRLQKQGYTVFSAANGVEALKLATETKPDMIISDVMMPEMDGFELCRRVKADERLKTIPFVFYSATFVNQEDEELAISLGASRFVIKPVDLDELLEIIEDVLREDKIEKVPVQERPATDDGEVGRMYAASLARKLDKKVRDLERERKDLRESEEKYRRIVEGLKQDYFFYSRDTNGVFTYLSPSIRNVLGYTQEEFLVHYLDYLTDNPVNIEAERHTDLAIKGEEQPPYELEIYHKDGSTRQLEVKETPIFDEATGVIAVEGIAHDITERKRVEVESEQLKLGIEQAAESIIITDDKGTIQYINPAFEETTGYMREEVVGQNTRFLKSGEHDKAFYKTMWDTLTGGETWRGQFVNKKKDGSVYIDESSISPVTDASGNIVSYISVQRDITREQELERLLLQGQKMESLGTLAGGIAHDFNNILQAISGFCNLAQKNVHDETLAKYLKEIEAGVRRAGSLVSQILTFSRTSEIETRPISLTPIIEEALRFLRSSIPATVQIESNINADCAKILANSTQIYQAVTNLCTNAMHAMEERGGLLTVSLEPVTIDTPLQTLSGPLEPAHYVQIAVTDCGTGIDPDNFERLLDPFFTTKEVGKGTGLGLAMVHGIMKSMDGGLLINSEIDKGTTVRLIFPVFQEVEEAPAAEQPRRSALPDTNTHVLLVDDEEGITETIRLLLASRGYKVDAYNDIDSVLKTLHSGSNVYDVAILDFTMPGKTGLELARDLYSLEPKLPVIIATGLLERSKLDLEKSPNIVAVIKKPFEIDDLIAVINRST